MHRCLWLDFQSYFFPLGGGFHVSNQEQHSLTEVALMHQLWQIWFIMEQRCDLRLDILLNAIKRRAVYILCCFLAVKCHLCFTITGRRFFWESRLILTAFNARPRNWVFNHVHFAMKLHKGQIKLDKQEIAWPCLNMRNMEIWDSCFYHQFLLYFICLFVEIPQDIIHPYKYEFMPFMNTFFIPC